MPKEPIAIIGLGCVLPDAPDVPTFWNNLQEGRNSIREVPHDRWDPELYWSADKSVPDKTYAKIGAFVTDDAFNGIEYRMPPKVVEQVDPCQRWALAATRQALNDAGYATGIKGDTGRDFDRDRCAVIVGNAMGGETNKIVTKRVFWPEAAKAIQDDPDFQTLSAEQQANVLARAEERYKSTTVPVTEDTMPGHLSNVIAGRIANAFDLGGKNFTTDAACASSLAALDAAMDTLRDADADMVVWGGTDRSMDVTPYIQFSKIGALSPDGSRPFDKDANGFVMGEGCAMFLLKRLSDAERDGDTVYATILGIGGSSDGKGKGITAPNPKGQVKAVRRAYQDAGVDPATVGYLEAHGTSTPVGDPVELQSVEEAFKDLTATAMQIGSIRVGSVKSNIGHLKAGAGAAGVLKAALAIHNGQLPPSINVRELNPRIEWGTSPFQVNTQPTPWNAEVRRAAVSSFGFGGTNFHVVLEQHRPGAYDAPAATATIAKAATTQALDIDGFQAHMETAGALEAEAVVLSAEQAPQAAGIAAPAFPETGSGPRLRDALHKFTLTGVHAAERVAFHVEDPADIPKKLAMAQKAATNPAAAKLAYNQGIFLGRGKPEGKVAFLFPGQGTQYVNMGRDLAEKYEVVRNTFHEADEALFDELGGVKLTDILWPTPNTPENQKASNEKLKLTEYTQPAVLAMDAAVLRLLQQWGVEPDVVAGHSLGEYGALVAAGVLTLHDALHAVAARGREMANVDLPDLGKMVSVSADWHAVSEAIEGVEGYVICANKNCPSQTVIAGSTEGVDNAVTKLTADGFTTIELPVSAAFHSEIVAPASEPLRRVIARLGVNPPKVPVLSNVGAQLYQDDPEWILDNLAVQVASPVEWTDIIEKMYADGVRTFIEVGPKRALTGFVADILKDKPDIRPIFANHPKQGGIASINALYAFLGANGFEPNVPALDDPALYTPEFRDPTAAFQRTVAAPDPSPVAPQVSAPAPTPTTAPVGGDRLDQITAQLQSIAAEVEQLRAAPAQPLAPVAAAHPSIAISGISVGLPGQHKPFFSEDNWDRILAGENLIDVLDAESRQAMVDKSITRLVKSAGGQGTFETIDDPEQVIKLAGRRGSFDLAEWGIGSELADVLDVTSQYALAAALEALRDAGIPLQRTYKETSTGGRLPQGWELPKSVGDETGVIFASAFPGIDAWLENLKAGDREAVFNRKFLFHVLSMGHAQVAQFLGARGPNTQVNAACASTTQAVAIAEDWIKAGRCKRVLVLGADDATSPNLMEWIGSGFLASGAATTKENVAEAALPFDARRHGMIIGMGAVGLVVEAESETTERGMRPIARLLATEIGNSAFHGSRLDVDHIAGTMQKLVGKTGLTPADVAARTVFMSHETYTPARGGSAAAEIHALRAAFGAAANQVVIANTKGFTGHPQGAGVEDAVVLKALQRGTVPPIPNLQQPDPELGDLRLSTGGAYDVRYALRLAAGFGSQVAMTFTELVAKENERFADRASYDAWLADVSGISGATLETVDRTLRIVDAGLAAPQPTPEPVAVAPAPIAVSDDAALEQVTAVVAEKTGYPLELLEADLDLEADLGIDTVKQAELFGELREMFGVPLDESLKLSDYNTLRKVAAYMSGGNASPAPTPAAPVAVEATPAPEPVQQTLAAPAGDVLQQVIDTVAAKTGYPTELLEPDLDLEADLGIDTVKQAELFGELRDMFGVPLDESLSLADYNTLAKVAAYMGGGTPAATSAPAVGEPAPAPVAAPAAPDVPVANDVALATVTTVVADKTGYPVELLEPDLDLEADLGIDTVKQAELFGELREIFGVPLDESLSLADYNTLRKVAAYMGGAGSGTLPAPSTSEPQGELVREAAPTEAPTSAEPSGDVLAQVTATVAEKTGYPVELLEPDLDLEADLGIDTVKQAELFGELRETFGVPFDESLSLADYNTLAKVAGYMSQGASAAPAPAAEAAPEPVQELRTAIRRLVPGLRPEALPDIGNQLPSDGIVLMLGQEPHPDFADAWHEAGFAARTELSEGQTPTGIVFTVTRPDEEDADIWAGQLFDAMKAHQAVLGTGTFVAVVTAQDGSHGLTAPRDGGMAAVAGFAKALRKELPDCIVKAIDLHPETKKPGSHVVQEILNGGPRTEVCYGDDGTRYVVDVAPIALDDAMPDVADKTLVVPGGAQGITAEMLTHLAGQGPNLVLMGRTPLPSDAATWATWDDTAWKQAEADAIAAIKEAGDKPTPVAVKKRLDPMRKAADMHATIAALTGAGASVMYDAVDVTDADGVKAVVDAARERFGSIDGIVHAAGVEISKMLADKPREQFDLVFGIKYLGLEALMAATADDDLEFLVAFGSVAGRFGNGGQVDYSAVNNLLAHEVKRYANDRSIPTAFTIAWGPWGEVGMATRGGIMTVLEASGVTPIPTADGVQAFLNELAAPGVRECVIAGELGGLDIDGQIVDAAWDPAIAEAESWLRTDPERFRLLSGITAFEREQWMLAKVRLDRVNDAYLMDHAIDGTPLLPGVFGIEAFAEAARLLAPEDQRFHGAENVRFASPLKQHKDTPVEATLEALVMESGDEETRIACTLSTQFTGPDGKPLGEPRTHFEATVRFGPALETLKTGDVPVSDASIGPDRIYPPFFHGPSFQVLANAGPLGDESTGTWTRPTDPMFAAGDATFLSHPMVTEGLFQLCGLRTMHADGAMSLPAAIEKLDILPGKLGDEARLWCRFTGTDDDGLRRFEGAACTPEGTVVLRFVGYGMIETGPIDVATEPSPAKAEPAPEPRPIAELHLPEVDGVRFHTEPVIMDAVPDDRFTADETERHTGFAAPKRAAEWLAARSAVKAAVCAAVPELAPTDVVVRNQESGAPQLFVRGEPSPAHLSITHRDGHAIIAFSMQPIGVDLETIEGRPDSWMEQAFTAAERDHITSQAEPNTAATCAWAAKEAALKRDGHGLDISLHDLRVTPDGDGGATVEGPFGTFGVRFFDAGGRILAVSTAAFDPTTVATE